MNLLRYLTPIALIGLCFFAIGKLNFSKRLVVGNCYSAELMKDTWVTLEVLATGPKYAAVSLPVYQQMFIVNVQSNDFKAILETIKEIKCEQ
jgi:hypothetical protein